ncbi:hypothetical protein COO60DRAFT_944551 [Scenedesmus sp. NREL 46B-D3]|nr:hypothetical protein COO60DRAFT_944551 [Scenedesmus sp. NREL 46B-D3]
MTANSASIKGGGLRASSAAVFMRDVVFSNNTAALFGGAVGIDSGLLFGYGITMASNRAGLQEDRVGLNEGDGAALHANSSALFLFKSNFSANEAETTGGCAVSATNGPVLVSSCDFQRNKCSPNTEQETQLSHFATQLRVSMVGRHCGWSVTLCHPTSQRNFSAKTSPRIRF